MMHQFSSSSIATLFLLLNLNNQQAFSFSLQRTTRTRRNSSSSSSSKNLPTFPILSLITIRQKQNRRNVDVGCSSCTALYSTMSEQEALQRQNAAKEALVHLLEKQRKELQETEELIENLNLDTSLELEQLQLQPQELQPHQDELKVFNAKTLASTLTKSIYAGTDYGFISRSEGCDFENVNDNDIFEGYGPPSNIFSLGRQQFVRNLNAMKGEYKNEGNVLLTAKQKKLQEDLKQLTLNSTAIWEREEARGEIVAPWVIKAPYYVLCYFLDVVFEGRYVFSRFFLLETVARMPYMTYITMLHLYETLGFWRRSADVKRVHFAEEWNEFHHLLVMESLGGDQAWIIRFISQHSALVYFIVLTFLFALSPSLSYKFSEMLETHAVDTYGQFIDENEEALKKLPPSFAALEYYTLGISDPMFGEYQTSAQATGGEIRKPGKDMTTLFDVFSAIRADEGDHVGTMKACLDPSVPVLSPALETRLLTGFALAATVGYFIATGDIQDGLSSTEVLENADDAIISDTVGFVDSILGGATALFGGLNGLSSKEVLENADDSLISDAVVADVASFVEGTLSGVAALFGGLNAIQGEAETAAETATEIEELASTGSLFVPLSNSVKEGLLIFFEALGKLR